MYDIPSKKNVDKVVVTESSVDDKKVKVIYKTDEKKNDIESA